MKIDLCKLLGVEEGEEFKIEGYEPIYFIQNGYLFNDSPKRRSCLNINDLVNKEIIKPPKEKKFSQDTLNFLKCIDKRYKYLAKDKSGTVYAFCEKPTKKEEFWDIWNIKWFACLHVVKDNLFDEILWEDEEPVYIDDYVER